NPGERGYLAGGPGSPSAGRPGGPGSGAPAMPRRSTVEDLPGWDTDQAVAAVYRAHYRSLARIAVLLAGDSAKGEAITQDAFAFMERARRLPASDRALGELRRAVVTRSRS